MTPEVLLKHFRYERDSGSFFWVSPGSGRRVGMRAGSFCASNGRRVIKLDGCRYLEHRLVWVMEHGALPTMEIDHIDGDPTNNVPSNLRMVSHRTNLENQRRPHRNNRSGWLGVHVKGDKWRSTIRVSGRSIHLGMFGNPLDAHTAYLQAKVRLHNGCTLINSQTLPESAA